MDGQDLLSAALGDAGLSFLDASTDETPIVPEIKPQFTINNNVQHVPVTIKTPTTINVPSTQVRLTQPLSNGTATPGTTPRIIKVSRETLEALKSTGRLQVPAQSLLGTTASGTPASIKLITKPSTTIKQQPQQSNKISSSNNSTIKINNNSLLKTTTVPTITTTTIPKVIVEPKTLPTPTKTTKNSGPTTPIRVGLAPAEDLTAIDEEDDEYRAETFGRYKPAKLRIGQPHPDPVVEATSLASVQPPDIHYRLTIPEDVIDEGKLSALQLESIVYASQQHETFLPDGSRAGFLLGDGAGVGKGRTLAGIIYENYELGRKKAIWLSVSNDLRYDAERDLRDIGAKHIQVFPLNKFKYGKIKMPREKTRRDEMIPEGKAKSVKGVIFATYSSLIGESTKVAENEKRRYDTRIGQLIHWFGEDYDGVIVFDECHKAKNLFPSGSGKPTKTGRTVLKLQRKLPKARIVYASATGASEPKNMAYMVRLGLWGPGTAFPDFADFSNAVEKRGVGAMEMVAIEMKLRGVYIARQLSFDGVEFKTEQINLSNKFIKLYNECVDLWVDAKFRFEKALDLMEDDNHIKKTVWGQFWGSHQRFFKYLCIAAKVKHAVTLARDALTSDKCVVIGLQSTGEAKTLEQVEELGELNDFVSTAKAVFQSLIEKHFPAPNRKKTMRLLNRDTMGGSSSTPSIFEELGISINKNGTTTLLPLEETKLMSSKSKTEPTQKWNISDSEDDSDIETNTKFEPSDDSDSDDDFIGVTDDDSESEFDKMWDEFQNKQTQKAKKRKIPKKKTPAQKRIKRAKLIKPKDDYKYIQAEFLSEEAGEICEQLRDELLEKLENMTAKLPPNTLDELIDELGGPDAVAEMTGRKGRVISNESGSIQYESRTENDVSLDLLNVVEKQRFMDGEKDVAIISEAASSGISLHSDRRAINRKRRVHITIELPWSADRAIQQFGRSHRSNQVRPPQYIFLISDLAGEKRFASIVAQRLQSLGALSHGDRRAKTDLSEYHIDSRYGRDALDAIMKAITGNPMVIKALGIDIPKINGSEEEFLAACRIALHGVGLVQQVNDSMYILEKDYNSVPKFLNRLLGIHFEIQNLLFKFFNDALKKFVLQAKEANTFSEGIHDISSDVSKVDVKGRDTFFFKHSTGAAKVELVNVAVDKGIPWDEAEEKWASCNFEDEGFYTTPPPRGSRITPVILAVRETGVKSFSKIMFRMYKPNTGVVRALESIMTLKKFTKITVDEAKKHWTDIYEKSVNKCGHELHFGKCRRKMGSLPCMKGARQKEYHILAGSILSVWDSFEKRYPQHFAHKSKISLVRLKTAENQNIIGIDVDEKMVKDLLFFLQNPQLHQPSKPEEKVKQEPGPVHIK